MPANLSNFVTRPDAHPVALTILLTDKYGPEWIGWESETLWLTMEKGGMTPSNHSRAKVQAVRTLLSGRPFFDRWEVFHFCCQAFNNNLPDFDVARPASVPQLFHAIWVADQLSKDPKYSDEVRRWIAACCLTEGVIFLPHPIDFAQKEALQTEYRCKKCGNVDPDDDTPQCDWCGAPPEELEKKPRYVDPEPVKAMWDLVKDKPSETVSLGEDLVGVQLARLLVARDYLDMRRQQAENQVRELGLWR